MNTHRRSLSTAAALVAMLFAGGSMAAAEPQLVVPEKLKDMGTVAQGEILEVEFELVNEGDETLEIRAVRPTCGCTVADYDREVPAGKSGFVKAKLDTGDFSGPISKSILIMTNDPEEPTVTVVIKTTVHPYVEVLPRALIRFNAVQHEPMTQKVTVVAAEDMSDFKVTGVSSNLPYLNTIVRPLAKDELVAGKSAQQFEVELSLKEDAPVGPVNALLRVKTNHPKSEVVPIKVFGVVRALLHVTPSQVQFGSVSAKNQPGRNLILVNNRSGGAKVSVKSATIDIDGQLANEEEIASGLLYAINRFRSFKGSDFSLNSLSTSISNLAREAIEGVAEFKHLIAHADFEIAFQPIIGVKSGRIHHYEALARFPARYGRRTPYEHVTFAEETGLIADFDLTVARKAIDTLRVKTPLNSKTCIAVNVSGQSVNSLSFLAQLDALLKEHPWSPGRLMFEITESARMQDLSAANAFIQRLRNQGYPVCLDDFGAGAANFEYLTTLDVDIVKFDGPALRTARKAQKGQAFLKAFVGLCRDLGIATVAEMIDDESALKFVRECGLQYVQGYLLGRPSTDIHAFKNMVPKHLFAASSAK